MHWRRPAFQAVQSRFDSDHPLEENMKVDLSAPVQIVEPPAPVSQTEAHLFYDGNTIAVVYGSGAFPSRDVVDAESVPALQAALDAHIAARLGAKLGVTVTKTPEPVVVVEAPVEPKP